MMSDEIFPRGLPIALLLAAALAGCGGGGGGGSATSSGGDSGSGSGGDAAAGSFQLSSHAVAVSGGQPFSLAANFFDDRFVPAAPVSNYGFPIPVIPVANADGSLDVAWLDYSGGGALPSASGLAAPGAVNITHIAADLTTATTTATGIRTYRLLGFTRDPSGGFYLAWNADSPFKTTNGDANDVDGNELRVARSASASFASPTWETTVFGDVDDTQADSPGEPGDAGSGVLAYDAQDGAVVTYVAHSMAWTQDGTRHQAGILRMLDAASGSVLAPGNGDPWETGSGWFYSHGFDQRLLVDGGTVYALAHGDAYPRQLGFAAFSKANYLANDTTLFDQGYWTIPGTEGDNTTNAETGQFFQLSSDLFAISHTSSDGRSARDVRLVLADAATGSPLSSAWLTANAANQQAVMPDIGPLGQRIFLTYGVWDSSDRTNHAITWYGQLLDASLSPVTVAQPLQGVEFVKGQPFFSFAGGPNAGAIGWVTGNAQGGLTVNVAAAGG